MESQAMDVKTMDTKEIDNPQSSGQHFCWGPAAMKHLVVEATKGRTMKDIMNSDFQFNKCHEKLSKSWFVSLKRSFSFVNKFLRQVQQFSVEEELESIDFKDKMIKSFFDDQIFHKLPKTSGVPQPSAPQPSRSTVPVLARPMYEFPRPSEDFSLPNDAFATVPVAQSMHPKMLLLLLQKKNVGKHPQKEAWDSAADDDKLICEGICEIHRGYKTGFTTYGETKGLNYDDLRNQCAKSEWEILRSILKPLAKDWLTMNASVKEQFEMQAAHYNSEHKNKRTKKVPLRKFYITRLAKLDKILNEIAEQDPGVCLFTTLIPTVRKSHTRVHFRDKDHAKQVLEILNSELQDKAPPAPSSGTANRANIVDKSIHESTTILTAPAQPQASQPSSVPSSVASSVAASVASSVAASVASSVASSVAPSVAPSVSSSVTPSGSNPPSSSAAAAAAAAAVVNAQLRPSVAELMAAKQETTGDSMVDDGNGTKRNRDDADADKSSKRARYV